jgi:hypothetical protein
VDLPKDRQRKLERYSLICVVVKDKTDRDVVFNIYLVRLSYRCCGFKCGEIAV